MNLDNAITAHAQWKTKFRTAITSKETMDAATIGKDNCCELGKWLYGEGRGVYGSKPEFTMLIEKHKAFHSEAGKVATTINAKKFDVALKMIEGTSPFGTASNTVVMAVNGLKKAIA
jgi:methyl-accepting chemotaxis protein